jgi:hypothetical protein
MANASRTLHLVVVMANELPLTEEKLELVGSKTGAPLPVLSPFREPHARLLANQLRSFSRKLRGEGAIL